MSYRELRKFTEVMKALNFPRVISLESFRQPNFELVAGILFWLMMKHDPKSKIPPEIAKDVERVKFLVTIAEVIQLKMHLKLNLKRLYQADGHAVPELLKVAQVLHNAMVIHQQGGHHPGDSVGEPLLRSSSQPPTEDAAFVPLMLVSDSKQARQLATELTKDGARLYDLLQGELEHRDSRTRITSRPQDVHDVEQALRRLVTELQGEITATTESLDGLSKDEATLEAKIENKRAHLERQTKRLGSLVSVRPAFMEEYEKLETELQHLYVVYLEQYRNMEFLESELKRFHRLEEAALEEQESRLRELRERLRKDELRVLRGGEHSDLLQ
eukprot:RCo016399